MAMVMIAVFFGLKFYQTRHNPQTASPNQAPPATVSQQAPASPAATAASSTAAAAVAATAESTTVVENELYRIQFTNRGAQVLSWQLKKYRDGEGKPLDLVHDQAARTYGYPLSLFAYDSGLANTLNTALYEPSATGTLPNPGTLTFKYSSGNGLTVTKTFSFDETYIVHADVQATQNGAPVRALLSWPGGFGDQEDARSYLASQVDLSSGGKVEHNQVKSVTGGATHNGPFDWAAVGDQYFATVFLPDQPETGTLVSFNHQIDVSKANRNNGLGKGETAKGSIMVPLLGAAFGDTTGHTQARIYAGPKAISILNAIHPTGSTGSLEPLLDFGFWGVIGKYLFYALLFIQGHLASNWGWAIILLTVLINLAMLPFRIKTMHSALKMQRIQPQMDAIKKKYAGLKVTDPKRNDMNAEIMQLQKDNGVSMFGGCVPTLMTLPLLWAFFTMLTKVVELRQAHWLWIHDLSAADPWHLLPIVMVVSQMAMQFYSPSPGVDPQQQKMMAFMMPAFSGYICWNYASGLALYWVIGNLIGIATQMVMNQTSIGKEMREMAAKRARRKAQTPGGGRPQTIQGKR